MAMTKKWTVDIYLDEHAGTRTTRAEARLHAGDATDERGVGRSWRNPHDVELPEVGDELAAARALVDLADQLQGAARRRIGSDTDEASHGW